MTKITENCYVNVEGWTQEEVDKAAEIFAEALGVPVGSVEVFNRYHYMYWHKPEKIVFVGTIGDLEGNVAYPVEITKEQVFASEAVEESKEWDGEGLPPVGVECECIAENGTYLPCKVIAQSEDYVIVHFHPNEYNYKVDWTRHGCKPLKTPEQKDKEESIQAMHKWMKNNIGRFVDNIDNMPVNEFYEYLYKNGWRITDQ